MGATIGCLYVCVSFHEKDATMMISTKSCMWRLTRKHQRRHQDAHAWREVIQEIVRKRVNHYESLNCCEVKEEIEVCCDGRGKAIEEMFITEIKFL